MARTVRDARTDSRSARVKLPPRPTPYWTKLTKGCHVGYRKSLRRDSGSWIIRWLDRDGKYQQRVLGPADDALDADGLTCLSFEQAQAKARDLFQTTIAVAAHGKKVGPYTVADCMADYLKYLRAHKKSGAHIDTYAKAYILPRLGKVDTALLTTAMIRDWHEQIAEEPPRNRTKGGLVQRYREEDPDPEEARRKRRLRANRHLSTLKAALTRAWRDGLIPTNDIWTRVKPFLGVERQRLGFLDHNEARRLVNTCPPDLRQLVQLALLTGARYGELCRLEVRDFHAAARTLFVKDSKPGKSRHVRLNQEGVQCCKQLVAGRQPTARLLVRADGGAWGRDLHARPFKEAVRRAGLPEGFTFHELRHTWASLSIMAGAPLIAVAKNLGHCDTRMVERHYGHLTDDYVSEVVQRSAPSFGFSLDKAPVALVVR